MTYNRTKNMEMIQSHVRGERIHETADQWRWWRKGLLPISPPSSILPSSLGPTHNPHRESRGNKNGVKICTETNGKMNTWWRIYSRGPGPTAGYQASWRDHHTQRITVRIYTPASWSLNGKFRATVAGHYVCPCIPQACEWKPCVWES